MIHSILASLQRNVVALMVLWLQLISASVCSNTMPQDQNTVLFQSVVSGNSSSFEKMYIHLDRTSYAVGEDIWFKVYLLDGATNMPVAKSKMVYVELISPLNKIALTRTIKTEEGGGEGEFQIPAGSATGEYTIRAYTNYMRNFDDAFFFRKKIKVRSGISQFYGSTNLVDDSIAMNNNEVDSMKPDVQFFPEGGHMVADLSSRLGFKALNSEGKGIEIAGYVEDETGKKIVEFTSLNFGMGSFRMNPETDLAYRAIVSYNGIDYLYNLPEILHQGVSMLVVDRGNHYQVNIQSTLPQGVLGLTFIGRQRGMIVSQAVLETNSKNGIVKIPMTGLRNGIVRFTLYDKNNNPIAERLVYAEPNEPTPKVNIQTDRDVYHKRELVDINLSLDVAENKWSQANVSVAVTDAAIVPPNTCDLDIESYLLLSSEIKGDIEEPCYYFNDKEPQRKKVLDLLMMTQGWRKYLWNEIENIDGQQFEYAHETGFNFSGTVKSIYNHKVPANSDVSLTFKNKELLGHNETKTYDQGKFLFQGYQFNDSTSIIIQAKKEIIKKGTKTNDPDNFNRDFFIEMDTFSHAKITQKPSSLRTGFEELNLDGPESRARARYLDSLYANQLDVVNLSEIELKAVKRKREQDKYQRKDMRYVQPTARVDYEELGAVSLGNDLFWALINNVPGLNRNLEYRGGNLSLSGNTSAVTVFLLNGVRVMNVDKLVNANDVSFIDVLTGPSAVPYSAMTVIAVYTKKESEKSLVDLNSGPKKGIMSFIHPGFYQARTFYEPLYKTLKPEDQKPDYRTTLYWKPTLKVDNNGKAKISFYTADATTTYRLEVEGITTDGYPVKNELFFDVK